LVSDLAQLYQVEVAGIVSDGKSLAALAHATRPDAVVLEDSLRSEGLIELASQLRGLGCAVVVIAGVASAALRDGLKALGASLVWSAEDDVPGSVAEALGLAKRPLAGQLTIVPASTKGGVGKTFLAVNLAIAIKEERPEARVMLVDALADGDGGTLLGINDGLTLADYAATFPSGAHSVEDLAPFIQQHSSGVEVLLAPRRLGRDVMPDREQFLCLLRELKQNYDVVVVDTAPGLSDSHTLLALAQAGVILLVTTPNACSIRKVLSLKPLLEELGLLRHCRLVLNMVLGPLEEEDLARSLGCPIAAHLPYDPAVLAAENKFQPLVCLDRSKAGDAVKRLAVLLLKEGEKAGGDRR